MSTEFIKSLFTESFIKSLFPDNISDKFFEALYGDSKEGAYDISLVYKGHNEKQLFFEFNLKQRRGKCLACNLTYGLPAVFKRHPAININGIIKAIDAKLNGKTKCIKWELGRTNEISSKLHTIPLIIDLEVCDKQ